MARDEGLEELLRERLASEPGLTEKPMFGGRAWLLNGALLCGARDDGMLVRLGADRDGWVLEIPDVAPMISRGSNDPNSHLFPRAAGLRPVRGMSARVPLPDSSSIVKAEWNSTAHGLGVHVAASPIPMTSYRLPWQTTVLRKLLQRLEVASPRPPIHVLECYESSYGDSQENCALRDYR